MGIRENLKFVILGFGNLRIRESANLEATEATNAKDATEAGNTEATEATEATEVGISPRSWVPRGWGSWEQVPR